MLVTRPGGARGAAPDLDARRHRCPMPTRRSTTSLAGSATSCCGSPPPDLTGTDLAGGHGGGAVRRWPPTCWPAALGHAVRPLSDAGDRLAVIGMGKLGRRRAQLRQRRRRAVRRRGRSRRRSTAPAADAARRSPAGASGSTRPATRGARRLAGAQRRRLRGVLGAVGRPVGAPGAPQGQAGRRRRRSSARAGADAAATPWCGARRSSADDLRHVRALKVRAEEEVRRRGVADREVKRGPGGIRDVEFSAQLLQLVHGRVDPDAARPMAPSTALEALAHGGYVDARRRRGRWPSRTGSCAGSSTASSSRTSARSTPSPATREDRRRLARVPRVPGQPRWRADRAARPRPRGRHRGRVRSVHERVWFRPLLASLVGRRSAEPRGGGPIASRRSGSPTSSAPGRPCVELTRGLTRLVADDAAAAAAAPRLAVGVARSGPRPARPAPPGLGGGAVAGPGHRRSASRRRWRATSPSCSAPAGGSATSSSPTPTSSSACPTRSASRRRPSRRAGRRAPARAVAWRAEPDERQRALQRWQQRHLLGIAARGRVRPRVGGRRRLRT